MHLICIESKFLFCDTDITKIFTDMDCVMMCMPMEPEEIIIDHPFIFLLLADGVNGINLLFGGRVLQPKC